MSATTIRASKRSHASSLGKIWRDFKRQPAQITDADITSAARIANEFEAARRVAVASMGRSGPQLIESAKELRGAKALAVAIVYLKRYELYLKELASLVTSAHTRLSMALCERPDMQELLMQAQEEYTEQARTGWPRGSRRANAARRAP